jgi:hypothetical protein
MAVDYTTATTVNVDDGVFSQDYNRLALAFNDRLKNGVGDPTWRLLWYAHSLVRGIRNPSGFLYAAEDEWWKVYAHIKQASGITWPTAEAGFPEGVNVSNPLGAFIYGMAPTVYNEAGRINASGTFDPAGTTLASAPTGVPLIISDPSARAPSSNADYWTLSKYQRGAVPSDLSDYSASNAIKASQEHGFINYPSSGFFLQNYGGFLPSPKLDSSPVCSDGYTPNYDLKFSNLVGGSDKTYHTCQPDGVMFYFEGFTSYKIIKWDGSTESLALTDYIEGPYTDNAYLRRYKGQQLNEVMNWFSMEYRANETERDEADMNRYSLGFQFQDFMTRQYCLAPAYGEVSTGSISAVYPTFELSGGESAGTYLAVTTSGSYSGTTTYTVPAKFTYAGFYAKTTGAGAGDVTIEVLSGSTSLTTFTITAVGGSTVDNLQWFASAHNEADIRFKLLSALPSSVAINIECAMLLQYKPTIYDAYVCLRLGSTDGPSSTGFDKSGYTFSNPKQISDNLLSYGCLIRGSALAGIGTVDEINENPVYESARRLIQNNLRMAERQNLVGYEVIGGKSYLHFKRFARGQFSNDLDVFDGVAPPSDEVASGDLIEGEVYQVWSAGGSGTVTYNSTVYNPITSAGHSGGEMAGTFFTATSVKTFTASGDAKVRIRNGIRSTPIKDNRDDRFRGQTNEWTTQQSTTVYKLSDSSIYKADGYGDILGFLTDRCGLLSCDWSRMSCTTGFAYRAEVNRQILYGSKMALRPENPSGYRYVLGSHAAGSYANTMVQAENTSSAGEGDKRHYESCQIYRPDYELEAVYIDPTSFYAGGDYDVIVKLSGRLENESAPPSISNSIVSWNNAFSGSYAPKRRTDENAVLEYLYHIASYGDGTVADYNCVQKIGDIAYDASASSGYWGNDFHGNCYPRFYFSKMVRHVWNDTNANYDAADSLTTVDEMLYMEFILQAISSGFIDKESTLQLSCTDENRLYDYTFPNLCYQALKMSKTEVESKAVTRATNTFTWEADPNALYTLVGVDGSGNETVIANSATSPHTQTGVATFASYKAYAGANKSDNRTIVDFTLTYTGGSNDNVITFTEDAAENVRYYLMGRTRTTDNSNPWLYYTGSGWSASESSAQDVSSPITVAAVNAKDEYRIDALVYGRKRWFEFLPATLRPDNAQGFGPLPNTNLYARIFNNLCNAVNLLVRARIDLPLNFQGRQLGATYYGAETSGDGTTTKAVPDTNTYPYDYGCSEGTTIVAAVDNFDPLTVEKGGASFGGAGVSDRVFGTAAGSWTDGAAAESVYDFQFGAFTASCGANVKQGCTTSGNTFEVCDPSTGICIDYYKFYIISSKHQGELRIKDENIKYALPVGIRSQFMDSPNFLGEEAHSLVKHVKDPSGGTVPLNNGIDYTGGVKYRRIEETIFKCAIYEGDVKMDAASSPLYGEFSTGDLAYDQRIISTNKTFDGKDNSISLSFEPYDSKPMFIKIPLVSRNYPANTY